MPKFKRVEDRWRDLRVHLNLFGNTEPSIELVAITTPINSNASTEMLPAIAAATSYGSDVDNLDKATALNKKLVRLGHNVPLRVVQVVLKIKGVSKGMDNQLKRYNLTTSLPAPDLEDAPSVDVGYVSASRRFQQQKPAFIYPMLDEIDNQSQVRDIYLCLSNNNKKCYEEYIHLRETLGASKEVARMCIPVASATERTWWTNIQEFRHIINQRCRADTESEFRRLAFMMYDLVEPMMPSLFEDITKDMWNSF